MGNQISVGAFDRRGPCRKAGDILNVFGYPQVHEKYVMKPRKPNQDRVVICRCWLSLKFPKCDNTHQKLWKQGIQIGPCMVQVDPRVVEKTGAETLVGGGGGGWELVEEESDDPERIDSVLSAVAAEQQAESSVEAATNGLDLSAATRGYSENEGIERLRPTNLPFGTLGIFGGPSVGEMAFRMVQAAGGATLCGLGIGAISENPQYFRDRLKDHCII